MGLNPNTAAVGLPGPETFLSRPPYWVKAKKKGLQDGAQRSGKQPGQSCSPALLTLRAPAAGRWRTRVVSALGVRREHSSRVRVSAGQASCRNTGETSHEAKLLLATKSTGQQDRNI